MWASPSMFGTLFTKWNFGEVFSGALLQLGLKKADYFVLLLGVVAMIAFSLLQRGGSLREKLSARPVLVRYAVYVVLLIAVITFGAYGIGYDSNQFIYNQF